MSGEESMHEYQDNGSPGVPGFAKRFVQAHLSTNLSHMPEGQLDFLPIPGIKPMLGMVIEAMGSWTSLRSVRVGTMTKPGYPTPRDQCAMIKNVVHVSLPLRQATGFLFDVRDLEELGFGLGDLIMLNLPLNPTGTVAKREWLMDVCEYCAEKGIRVFNDAAYAILVHTNNATTLADVAISIPKLDWAEAFSASKAGNNTGWRIGAMVGTPEFIGDIKRIKGNTDSGFAAPMAAGILHLYEKNYDDIRNVRTQYASRLTLLAEILTSAGMKLAVRPEAGFFVLFERPKRAFGQDITDAEGFNNLMIKRTGIVGVPFEPYIRYAVCTTDIEAVQEKILLAFKAAEVSY